jgi:putative ABC transport system substrate-binding protein
MRRRVLGIALVFALMGWLGVPTARAQEASKVARIGWLGPMLGSNPHFIEAFRRGLRDLGYVEGRHFVMEFRGAGGQIERFSAVAAELVALKVDVIVAGGTIMTRAAMEATRTIPIVCPVAGDAVADGLVTSLARPGGNVTGLSLVGVELVAKRLELFKLAIPGISRLAVLRQPGALPEGTEKAVLKEYESAARALGLQLQFAEVRRADDLEKAFSDVAKGRANAVALVGGAMFFDARRRIVGLAARHRLPAVYSGKEFVIAGGLMSYGVDLADMHRRAATYVDKILKGAKPGDLPMEQPTKFEMVINLKGAKAIGLTLSPAVLSRADEVVER